MDMNTKDKKDNPGPPEQGGGTPADSGHSEATCPGRWESFTDQEIATVAGALLDSGRMRLDFAWYLQCSRLHQEIVLTGNLLARTADTASPLAPSEEPEPSDSRQVRIPPLGLMPDCLWEAHCREARIGNLVDAMKRYAEADLPAKPEWISELTRLLEAHRAD